MVLFFFFIFYKVFLCIFFFDLFFVIFYVNWFVFWNKEVNWLGFFLLLKKKCGKLFWFERYYIKYV